MRDRCDAELVQEVRELGESHAAHCKGVAFGIGHGLGSRLLLSRSLVDLSSEDDHQSTCGITVSWASRMIRMDVTSR